MLDDMLLLLPYVTVNGVDDEEYTEIAAEELVLAEPTIYDDEIGTTV